MRPTIRNPQIVDLIRSFQANIYAVGIMLSFQPLPLYGLRYDVAILVFKHLYTQSVGYS